MSKEKIIKLIEQKNEINNNDIKSFDDKNKINKKFRRIEKLKAYEKNDKDKLNYQIKECYLKEIKIINEKNKYVNSVSIFPSGNIIIASSDKSLKIFDFNFNILQNIENAHNDSITYVSIKDENNFVTCSFDNSIKTWIKYMNKFKVNINIINAHYNCINKVIYFSNGNLISCSNDKTIKIWEENYNIYQSVTILNHLDIVCSILLIEDKNKLITSGLDGTKILKINNFELIKYYKESDISIWIELCRIDEDKIIIGGYKSMKIISLSQEKIVKKIKISFNCLAITMIKNKGLFFVGGNSKKIMIYRNDNYECIQIINNEQNKDINGFIELKNDLIVSFSDDNIIKIWSF